MGRQDLRIFNCGKHILMLDIRGTLVFHGIFYMPVFYYLLVQNASHFFIIRYSWQFLTFPLRSFGGSNFFCSKIITYHLVMFQASSLFKGTCRQSPENPNMIPNQLEKFKLLITMIRAVLHLLKTNAPSEVNLHLWLKSLITEEGWKNFISDRCWL